MVEERISNRDRLEAIDREIAFYRHRAGQVFFLGLAVEVLILAGKEKLVIPAFWAWVQPLSYGVLFMVVAAVGILLGQEYRGRIHDLKEERTKLAGMGLPPKGLILSEIQVLYVVLVFLSSAGLVLVWLNAIAADKGPRWAFLAFWGLFYFFVLAGTSGIVWVAWKIVDWLRQFRRRRHQSK